ncbi:hypothetical protein KSF73_09635 [Burkholderiaceae bacterium DAT-1]|nr:hypothetical protein [Burkholderiaceae bacterium DAT-1]
MIECQPFNGQAKISMHLPHIESWAEQAHTLFELINPGFPDRADEQYQAFLDELAAHDDDEFASTVDLMNVVKDIIDGESACQLNWRAGPEFVEGMLRVLEGMGEEIDWGVDDPLDDDWLKAMTVPELVLRAADGLQDAGYTLWCWQIDQEHFLAWLTQSVSESEMASLVDSLGLGVCVATDLF